VAGIARASALLRIKRSLNGLTKAKKTLFEVISYSSAELPLWRAPRSPLNAQQPPPLAVSWDRESGDKEQRKHAEEKIMMGALVLITIPPT